MRRMQLTAALVAALMSMTVLTACGDDADDAGNGGDAAATSNVEADAGGGAARGIDASKEPIVVAVNAVKIQAADLYTPYKAGSEAAAKQINAQGGFGGREVRVESCNTAYQPSVAVVCARKALAKKPVASIGCEPTWATSGLTALAKAGIPSFNCMNIEGDFENPMSFGMTQGATGGQRASARWLCTRDDVKKVAVFTQDLPAQRTAAPDAVGETLKQCGKTATFAYYPITGADLLPHVSKVAKDKPDFVIALGGGPLAVQVYKLFGQAGIPADRIIISANAMAYEQVLKPAGSAMDGAYAALETLSWGDTEDPGVAAYLDAMKGSGVDERDVNPQTAYMQMMTLYEAAKEIGFDTFDSKSLIEFMNTADEVSVPNSRQIVNPGPEKYPQVKQPFSQIVQWKDGKLISVAEGTEDGWVRAF